MMVAEPLKVGQRGRVEWNGIDIYVTVLDTRSRYGHTDFLISPVSGVGERWVEHSKVQRI